MPSSLFVNRLYSTLKEHKVFLVYVPLVVYWGIIFTATSIPVDGLPKLFDAQDKLEHFAAYFILEILLALTLHFQDKFYTLKLKPILFSLLFLSLYAALDEIHQYFIPGRYADVLDWAADVIGGSIAIFLLRIFFQKTSVLHRIEE
ncbi:MAG: VanZ family protein [Ignavibacteria bacterium]|nr:VanZ family protein [Ignavibacteria bacterium]